MGGGGFSSNFFLLPPSLLPQTTLTHLQEDVAEALGNKNPSVKAEVLLFLCRCFQQCVPSMLPKPLLKALCPLIVQVSSFNCVNFCE